jgi:glycosyltransferase involved in cell wall biosynthesis
MRITVVTTSYPSERDDAAGHFVRAEVRALEREGHDVHVVAPQSGGAFGWPGALARVREKPWRAIEAAWWIARARASVAGADRVVAHWAVPCAWPIGIAARELEVVSHGGDVRALVKMPATLRAAIVRAIAGRARSWRFVSETLMEELLASLGSRDAERVRAIARVEAAAIEMPDVNALRAAGDARRRALGAGALAVSVGRLVASKRVDAAIAHVARTGARIVVVGDGPERARLEAHAAALGVDARFVGKVTRDEALAWIAAADVLVHASRAEGMSTVLREARALGTRVEVVA